MTSIRSLWRKPPASPAAMSPAHAPHTADAPPAEASFGRKLAQASHSLSSPGIDQRAVALWHSWEMRRHALVHSGLAGTAGKTALRRLAAEHVASSGAQSSYNKVTHGRDWAFGREVHNRAGALMCRALALPCTYAADAGGGTAALCGATFGFAAASALTPFISQDTAHQLLRFLSMAVDTEDAYSNIRDDIRRLVHAQGVADREVRRGIARTPKLMCWVLGVDVSMGEEDSEEVLPTGVPVAIPVAGSARA